jgi:hypothetical protein
MSSEAPQWQVRTQHRQLVYRMLPNLPVQVLRSVVHAHGHSVHGAPDEVRHPGMLRGSLQVHRMLYQSKRLVPVPAVLQRPEV